MTETKKIRLYVHRLTDAFGVYCYSAAKDPNAAPLLAGLDKNLNCQQYDEREGLSPRDWADKHHFRLQKATTVLRVDDLDFK